MPDLSVKINIRDIVTEETEKPASQNGQGKTVVPQKTFQEMFEEDHFDAPDSSQKSINIRPSPRAISQEELTESEKSNFSSKSSQGSTLEDAVNKGVQRIQTISEITKRPRQGSKVISIVNKVHTAYKPATDSAPSGQIEVATGVVKKAIGSAIPAVSPVVTQVGGAVVSVAMTAKSAWDVKKTSQRIEEIKEVMEEYDFAVPENLESISEQDEAMLTKNQLQPQEGDLIKEAMHGTLQFALMKMGRRQKRLAVSVVGGAVSTVGAAMTAAGTLGAGIGAVPGVVTTAVGGVISSGPTVYAAGRAVTKENKGATRQSSAQFLLGMALRKAVQDERNRLLDSESRTETDIEKAIKQSPEARKAYLLANQWVSIDPGGTYQAQEAAAAFLKKMGIVNLDEENDSDESSWARKTATTIKNTATAVLQKVGIVKSNKENEENKNSCALQTSELPTKGLPVIMDLLKSTP